jgi:hypothetical protein
MIFDRFPRGVSRSSVSKCQNLDKFGTFKADIPAPSQSGPFKEGALVSCDYNELPFSNISGVGVFLFTPMSPTFVFVVT